ncbi:AAA family ATPase [Aliivibrio sp. S4TY2]|uniref:AAA family ATPase n=1 Tax=unclassified Aliivibrio TaxID=2645654 RepID=UPI00237971D8|nr:MULTISPECIES: AAA family ATPase [unclassified Aliivibrio]MDD9154580.1 AAA family ATPase [Aliivibrio sp. S4TY2]MDD9159057.1 AAA family ATPase [Aliivibrio sp. S4TY1]MDD9162583.1 AAA family ATPase [Aliivibrio sp. S4MY2]MDD9167056.1 AAA family ATPase [Aliivibrio sp. S4MY4]MDD9183660.1 AAA family ATPase [Aliivibrio sp. S4MY3]
MKFHIENLGKIKQADIKVNDLTIICGPNSASKTWLSYSIYHHLNSIFNLSTFFGLNHNIFTYDEYGKIDIESERFQNELSMLIKTSFDNSNSMLHKTFNTFESIFEKSVVSILDTADYTKIITEKLKDIEINLGIANHPTRIQKEKDSNIIDVLYIKDEEPEEENTLSKRSAIAILLSASISSNLGRSNIELPNRPFVITSERVGSLVFQKDIDGTALSIKESLESFMEEYSDNSEVNSIIMQLNKLTIGNRASLAIPVRKNLLAVRNADSELKKQSYLAKEHPYVSDALNEIVKGKFTVDNGTLVFSSNDDSHQLPITITSSSIKSLFMIDLYINSLAKKGDVLLIDEPELNLHPDNQRLMAKVITRIANSGIKVLITTHSDYLIREINNSISLSNDFENKNKLLEQYSYLDQDVLQQSQVSAYSVSNTGNVSEMNITNFGIDDSIFDNIINEANQRQEDIMYAVDPSLFEDE